MQRLQKVSLYSVDFLLKLSNNLNVSVWSLVRTAIVWKAYIEKPIILVQYISVWKVIWKLLIKLIEPLQKLCRMLLPSGRIEQLIAICLSNCAGSSNANYPKRAFQERYRVLFGYSVIPIKSHSLNRALSIGKSIWEKVKILRKAKMFEKHQRIGYSVRMRSLTGFSRRCFTRIFIRLDSLRILSRFKRSRSYQFQQWLLSKRFTTMKVAPSNH